MRNRLEMIFQTRIGPWNDLSNGNWALTSNLSMGLCLMNEMLCMALCLSKATLLMHDNDLYNDLKVSKVPLRWVMDGCFFCSKASCLSKDTRLFNGVIAWFHDTRIELNDWWCIAWLLLEQLERHGDDLPLCNSSFPSLLGLCRSFPWKEFESNCTIICLGDGLHQKF